MTHFQTWTKAWELLDREERRRAALVLLVVIFVGVLSAGMIGSVFPFLAVLADRDAIARFPLLSDLYRFFGFSSADSFVVALGLGALAIIITGTATQILRAYAISFFCAKQAEGLGIKLLNRYLRQPYVFFLDQHTGNLQSRVLAVSYQVIDNFFRPAAEICAAGISALAILGLIFWFAPVISIYCILILGGTYGLTYAVTRYRIAKEARSFFSANQARFRITSEALGGIKALKILGKETVYVDRFRKPAQEAARAQLITGITSEIPNYVLQALAFGGVIVLALVMISSGEKTAQEDLAEFLPILGLLAFAGQRLLPELQRIYAAFTQMQHGHIAVATLHHDLIELQSLHQCDAGLMPNLNFSRELALDNVQFTYPNSDHSGLKDISLRITAGERIGVVGKTGAGKSTLADILLGLIQPDSGVMRADDIIIEANTLRSWQGMVGYVPQDMFLVDASIKENIAFGCLPHEIDIDRVEKACEIAQLASFVANELPDGLDTLVGERGVKLSGGQRQRIGIARAIYRDASFLVFDEATSALDPLTERDVMSSIDALPGEITMVLIAHRLSTVANCDRIIVLDHGGLAAIGTWDDLLKTSSIFRSLVEGRPDSEGKEA
ncbi:MAG: ABC transporter ATP-binding protein [Paracoccaceae bacterium]